MIKSFALQSGQFHKRSSAAQALRMHHCGLNASTKKMEAMETVVHFHEPRHERLESHYLLRTEKGALTRL
jgi:hypothetical protein